MSTLKTLHLQAHSRDCNSISVYDENGRECMELNGYVPVKMCIGGGDDVELVIDIETGTIQNWDAEKVRARLEELRPVEDEDE